MTKLQWIERFDQHFHSFEWFYRDYGYEKQWNALLEAREKEHIGTMVSNMNKIWFMLPDCIFNIKVKPNGWMEFLYILENEPNY